MDSACHQATMRTRNEGCFCVLAAPARPSHRLGHPGINQRMASVVRASVLLVSLIAVAGDTSSPANEPRPPPLPKPGPLAQPRSTKQVGLPADQTLAAIPPDNPQTPEKIALGQKLFFDGRLSVDGTVGCATCHDPERAFADGRPTSIGVRGRSGQRNSPTVLNALYNKTQFWDGRAKTLEDQAALPIVNPVEMAQPDLETAVKSLAAYPEYQQAFQKVFGRPPNGQDLVAAIASYERTLASFDSPFDRYHAGDENAIDESAKRGWVLFNNRARCNKCHALPDETPDLTNFKDDDFHNIGVLIVRHRVAPLARKAAKLVDSGNAAEVDRAAIQTDMSALGRFLVTKKQADLYNKGAGLRDPWLDQDMQPLALKESELDDLVAFMASLTSDAYREQGAKELARQRALARTNRPFRDTRRAFGPKPRQPEPPPP
jgi:cytochrome c peroxidase